MPKQSSCLVLSALILCLGAELPLQARSLPAQEKLKEREEASPAVSNENKSSAREETRPVFTPQERAELQEMAKGNTNASEERLRELLREYSSRFPGLISTAGLTLNQQPGDYRDKHNAVMWQYACVSNVNSITVQPNPQVALIDLLTYTTRALGYVNSPDGQAFLGEYQPDYAEVMKEADEWAWWLADFVLGDKDYAILKREVTDWCAKNPMTSFMGRENIGLLAGDRFVPPPLAAARRQPVFQRPGERH